MKAKELLKPRFELTCKFPFLRKMNWWEKRKLDDMPNKLICVSYKDGKEVIYIERWDMVRIEGWTNDNVSCGLTSVVPEYGFFPVD